MAAPSGTTWGNIITGSKSTRKGKIGIYIGTSDTATSRTITAEVWYWSMYAVDDTNNTLYADWDATTATSSQGSKSIITSGTTGEGWLTSRQVKIASYSKTYTRGTSAQTKYFAAKITGIDNHGASNVSSHYRSFTIPALASYTISYNANGGSGAPSSQTKYYGKDITLAGAISRTGYSFQKWNTKSDGSGTSYNAGASYTANAAATLYAIWKANTYTVKFDANGGTGAPANQTKTYGVTLKLSTTKPTRQYYNFLGWSTSKTATSATYAAGGNFTTNAATTLYAVWELAYIKPRITDVVVNRCTLNTTTSEDGTTTDDIVFNEEGTSALVNFNWATDFEVTSIKVQWKLSSSSTWSKTTTISASGTSGSVSQLIGSDDTTDSAALLSEYAYTIAITVTDTESTVSIESIAGSVFPVDVLFGGTGVSFGKRAELEGVADIAFQTRMLGGILHPVLEPETDLDNVLTPNTYVGENVSTYNYGHCPLSSGTFTLEVVGMGDDGQIKQRLTCCHKTASRTWERIYYSGSWNYDESTDPAGGWICVSDWNGTLLASPGMYMTSGHTVELSEPISKQPHGVKLVFSLYSGGVSNSEWVIHDVPKYMIINHPSGGGYAFECNTSFRNAIKYLYIKDTSISGHDNNGTSITVGGITYTNGSIVLRYVIGY